MASAKPTTTASTSDVPLLRPADLAIAITTLVAAQRPAIVTGPPGVGKSRIMAQVAAELGMELIDMRLSIRDAVDLRGVPKTQGDQTVWCPPAELPTKGKGILFLDELTSAPSAVQVAAYQLILDRGIGEYRLPKDWTVMAAGNREEDGAVVFKMSSALNSRLVHIGMDTSAGVFHPDWHQWAIVAGLHPHVIGFIKQFPDELNQFDKSKKAYPCARTWEFVSDILKQDTGGEVVERALVAGTIGPEMATKFMAHRKFYKDLPMLDDILRHPTTAKVPSDPSARFALSAALSTKVTAKNFDAILTYASRMPSEFTVMTIQDCLRVSKVNKLGLDSLKVFIDWTIKNSAIMGAVA